MKKQIVLVILLLMLTACNRYVVYVNYDYEKSRYYDKKGRYSGYSERTSPVITRYYDKQGRYSGYSVQSSTGVRYYDSKGRATIISRPGVK